MRLLPSRIATSLTVLVLSIGTSGLVAGAAGASASPPTAVTGPPSSLTFTEATVSGDVDPQGTTTTWYFEYGTTASYGADSTPESAGAAAHTFAVATRLSGLTPGTTYHYRLVAKSAAGADYGADAAFKTPASAPTVLKQVATSVHDTSAHVTVVLVPNGLTTTWYARYGTSSTYSATSAVHNAGSGVGEVSMSTALAHLSPHTEIHFDVVATNAAGTSTTGDADFVTTGPPIVTAQSTGALTPTTAVLTGSVVPDGHPTTAYFQYGLTASYGSTTAALHLGTTMSTVAVSRSITGLVANTVYHYRLVAASSGGTGAGGDATFTTPGPTLGASLGAINFGRATTLSGTVPNGAANEAVALYSEAAGTGSFVAVATVLTGAGGSWSYSVNPRIGTVYKVVWKAEVSPQVGVTVSPSVTLRSHTGGVFVSHVTAARSLRGKLLRLQRFVHGSWRTVASARLDRTSSASFHPSLPRGRSRLRMFLTAFQAGGGYSAGFSAEHVIRAS